jgi:hypothetical protein
MTAFLAECHPVGQPRVQLGDTALIGSHLQASNVEFFGGLLFPHFRAMSFSTLTFQESHLPSLQSVTSAFLLPNPSIPCLPYDHSMLVITVTHAYSL